MATKPASIKFSNTHGQNIELRSHRRAATWVLQHQGGYCFLNTFLKKHDSISFNVTGSGHARFGFTYKSPASTTFNHKHDPDSKFFRLRQKKQITSLTISRDEDKVCIEERENNIESVDWAVADHDIVVFVDIQFGDLTVDIDSDMTTSPAFDGRYGDNITIANHNRRISLKHPNLSALCGTGRPIHQGEIIIIDIEKLKGANWTYTNLYFANYSPDELQLNSLDADVKRKETLCLVPIGIKFGNVGVLHLRIEKDKVHFSYLMDASSTSLQELDTSKPVYVYAELFRMKMKIRSTVPKTHLTPYLRADAFTNDCTLVSSEVSQILPHAMESDETHEHMNRRVSPLSQGTRIPQFGHQASQNEAVEAQACNLDPDVTDQKSPSCRVNLQPDTDDSLKEQTTPKLIYRM